MAAGHTASRGGGVGVGQPQVITLTGLTAATNYTVEVTHPSGKVSSWSFTTDGAGSYACPTVVCNEQGTYTLVAKSVPAQVYTTTWKT